MGLYNFKKQFVPFVLDGSKMHTIRGVRSVLEKPGNTCHLYTGLRQKGAQLLLRAPCVKVEQITIDQDLLSPRVLVNGVELDRDEMDALAWRDGFREPRGIDSPFDQMMEFWTGRLPFEGYIIHWDYQRRFV